MRKSLLILAVGLFVITGTAMGQIWEPEGLNMPGNWNGFMNPPTNNLALASSTQVTNGRVTKITTGTTRWQTVIQVAATGGDVVGGNYNWLFTTGPEGNPFQNKWAGVNVNINQVQTYTHNTGADNNITITNGKWYTVNWRDNGYSNTSAIFMETSAQPVTIESVSQDPLVSAVDVDEAVTVTVTTSAAPAADEFFFVWYKIGSTSSVVAVTFDGTEGTAEIPGQVDNTVVNYRVISSTIALTSGQSDEHYWMRSIRFSDQFTYTVSPPDPPAAITLTSPAAATSGLLPTIAFSWEEEDDADTYSIQVASDAGFSNIIASSTGLTGTSISIETGFVQTGFWRVRGVNNGGNGDWSEARTFSTVTPKATFLANGLGGFGEPVGGSTLQLYDDGTTITGVFNKGLGNFNDRLVIYIATGDAGRNQITGVGVNDRADNSRGAVSFTSNSTLTFPFGFEANYAIAIGTTSANLFEIPASGNLGNGGLDFVRTVRSAGFANTAPRFVFSFDWEDIGFESEDAFRFVATYLNPTGNDGAGFVSNEGYGSGLPSANVAGGSATFTTSYNYPTGDVSAILTFSGSENWRFLSSPVSSATYGDLLNGLWTQGFTGSNYPAAGASNSNIRTLNGATSAYVSISNLTDVPAAGAGFAAGIYRDNTFGEEGTFPKVVSVTGSPNSGDISPTLNPEGQFTLVGNPYPYPINFDLTTRTDLASTIYVYDYVTPDPAAEGDELNQGSSQGVFRSWNGSVGSLGNYRVAPFQGFLVYASGAAPALTFTNASRAGSTIFRGKESEPVAFELEVLGRGLYSSTWMHFSSDASEGFDSKDAMKWYPFSESFLSLKTYSSEMVPLDINHFPTPETAVRIPLDIMSTVSGSFTLRTGSLWNIPETWSVQLVDEVTGEIWTLGAESGFTLNLEAGTRNLVLVVSPVGTTNIDQNDGMPTQIALSQNYPNPFNPSTVIRFELPSSQNVKLAVYDLLGREISVLVNESMNAGTHAITFDASALSSGVYVYRLEAGAYSITRKMTLVK